MIVSRRRPINQRASGRILPCRRVQGPVRRPFAKEINIFRIFCRVFPVRQYAICLRASARPDGASRRRPFCHGIGRRYELPSAILNLRLPNLNSRLPILNSRLPILNSRLVESITLRISEALASRAALAQLVEHIIRNDGVRCSSHLSGTTRPFAASPAFLDVSSRRRRNGR